MRVSCLILAAGEASRMGSAKQLLPFGEKTLLQWVIETALQVDFEEIRLVLGAHRQKIMPSLKNYPVAFTHNPHWEEGMGTSIAMGMKEILPGSEAVLIMLGDQPFVGPDHLQALISHHKRSRKSIVASYYREKAGVPALFTREKFDQLKQLKGKEGAGRMIRESQQEVYSLALAEAAIDIDTPKDYQKWKNSLK